MLFFLRITLFIPILPFRGIVSLRTNANLGMLGTSLIVILLHSCPTILVSLKLPQHSSYPKPKVLSEFTQECQSWDVVNVYNHTPLTFLSLNPSVTETPTTVQLPETQSATP